MISLSKYFYLFLNFFYEGYHYFRDVFTRPYSMFRLLLWGGSCISTRRLSIAEKFRKIERIGNAMKEIGYNKRTQYFPSLFLNRNGKYSKKLQYPLVYVPGLSADPFPNKSKFTWALEFEQNYELILAEFKNVAKQEGILPYHIPELRGKATAEGWNTFFFMDQYGELRHDNIEKCPKTWELLNGVPGFVRANMTMFSVLQPHSKIEPHTGWSNLFTRVHLTLVNKEPLKSAIVVGNEISGWEEGKLLFLDDSFFHQVWNSSDHYRAVLFFDVWHPDFNEDEIIELDKIYKEVRVSGDFKKMSEVMQKIEAGATKKIFKD